MISRLSHIHGVLLYGTRSNNFFEPFSQFLEPILH